MRNCTMDLSDRLPQSKKEKRRSAMAARVKAAFESEGYTLRGEYVTSKAKLKFTCSDGHNQAIRWNCFQQGQRCAECAGRIVTHEQVRAAFEAEGYALKSEYVNNYAKLEFTCAKGHNRSMTWSSFQQGHRCAECAGKAVTHERVKAAFETEGYILKGEYVNSHAKLEFTCAKGHNRSIAWGNFQQGQRCAECAGQVVTHEQVKVAFDADGYTLKSEYVNSHTKLEFTCAKGHDSAMPWSDFRVGHRCGECAGMTVTHKQVEAAFEAEGYTLKSEYVNSHAKLEFTCAEGHNWAIAWNNFQQGNRCVQCAENGYNPSKAGTIYYARFDLPNQSIWKIGITNSTIAKRFRKEPIPYEIIWQQRLDDGRVPPQMERSILKKYKKYQYKGSQLISGNTECFTIDVLGYDRPSAQLSLIPAM